MEATGEFQIPSAFPRKEHPLPIRQEAGRALKPDWMLWRRENLSTHQESKPGHPARRVVTIVIELPLFHREPKLIKSEALACCASDMQMDPEGCKGA
jgi:hypothetical protein